MPTWIQQGLSWNQMQLVLGALLLLAADWSRPIRSHIKNWAVSKKCSGDFHLYIPLTLDSQTYVKCGSQNCNSVLATFPAPQHTGCSSVALDVENDVPFYVSCSHP